MGRLVLGAGLICAATAAGEKCKYLAMVGPTPIRFQALTPHYDPAKVLPPLKMADAPDTNTVESLVKTGEVTAPKAPDAKPLSVDPIPVPESNPAATPATTPNTANINHSSEPLSALPEIKPEPSQLTPQMLLRYFNKEGTREVIVPGNVEFTPPAPAPASGRSSAVYTSPPAK